MSAAHNDHTLIGITGLIRVPNIRNAVENMGGVLFFADGRKPTRANRVWLVPCAGGIDHCAGFNKGLMTVVVGNMEDERSIVTSGILHLIDVPSTDGDHPRVQMQVRVDF